MCLREIFVKNFILLYIHIVKITKNMINVSSLGSSKVFSWTKEYLVKLLTTGKNPIVTDPTMISALTNIDRANFVPSQFKNQAYSDLELDIGYGEKLTKPTVVAQMIALLKPKFGGKYLDIGTGTGYSAALLAFVAGDQGHVYTIERVQWLWEMARTNIGRYHDLRNIDFLYRDGLEGLVNQAPFDGIHIAFAVKEVPEKLKMQLKVGDGRLVCPTEDMNLRIIERTGVDQWTEEIVPGFVFGSGKEGLA